MASYVGLVECRTAIDLIAVVEGGLVALQFLLISKPFILCFSKVIEFEKAFCGLFDNLAHGFERLREGCLAERLLRQLLIGIGLHIWVRT